MMPKIGLKWDKEKTKWYQCETEERKKSVERKLERKIEKKRSGKKNARNGEANSIERIHCGSTEVKLNQVVETFMMGVKLFL